MRVYTSEQHRDLGRGVDDPAVPDTDLVVVVDDYNRHWVLRSTAQGIAISSFATPGIIVIPRSDSAIEVRHL